MTEIPYALGTVFGLYDVAEGSARLIAALLLVLHPVHEQSLNFRGHFNARVLGWFDREPVRLEAEKLYRMPLGKKMNALQAIALATVFPALALFGPWWALIFIGSFYVGDVGYTHDHKKIPGFLSAVFASFAICVCLLLQDGPRFTDKPIGTNALLAIGAALAGLVALAFPWIMAYRRVRRG